MYILSREDRRGEVKQESCEVVFIHPSTPHDASIQIMASESEKPLRQSSFGW